MDYKNKFKHSGICFFLTIPIYLAASLILEKVLGCFRLQLPAWWGVISIIYFPYVALSSAIMGWFIQDRKITSLGIVLPVLVLLVPILFALNWDMPLYRAFPRGCWVLFCSGIGVDIFLGIGWFVLSKKVP